MFAFTYVAGVLATVFAVLGCSLIARPKLLSRALGYYLATASLWLLANAFADVAYTEASVRILSGLAFVAIGLNLTSFLVLIDVLIDGRLPSRGRMLVYSLNIVPSLFSFSTLGVAAVAFPEGAPAQITPGALYAVGLLLILADFGYGAWRLRQALARNLSATRRQQLLFVVTGLLLTVLGLLFFDVVLPLLGEHRFYTFGPLSSMFFAAGCAYAIARHRFMELRLVIEVLERKVEERTEALQALQESQRQLIFDLSHRLQTPLAVLTAKLERLQKTMLHDRELMGVDQSIIALSSCVDDLLSLAGLETALQNETQRPFSLSNLLEEVAEEVGLIAEDAGITVAYDIAPGITLYGNEKRLREAIMNIAANAVAYIGNGPEKRITFTLSENGDGIQIGITDTGSGIAEADLPHIFERFYRAVRAYDAPKGTGLGLAIAKRIVEEREGTIEVESEEGRGTTFTLTLPRRASRS